MPRNNDRATRRRLETAGGVLGSLLSRMESGPRIRESLALAYWSRVVGAQAAAATQAEEVQNGTLFVRTKSSAWSHELTLLKHRVLADLAQLVGPNVITDIRFRARGMPPPAAQASRLPEPTEEEIQAVRLLPTEAEQLADDIRAVHDIADDAWRTEAELTSIRQWKLRRWRLDHGWRACRVCQAAHHAPEPECPICRVVG